MKQSENQFRTTKPHTQATGSTEGGRRRRGQNFRNGKDKSKPIGGDRGKGEEELAFEVKNTDLQVCFSILLSHATGFQAC